MRCFRFSNAASMVTVLATCSINLVAQTLPDDPTRAPVTASLVPIGANSDAYWTGDGPGMRAIALDPGAAPPATWCIRNRKRLSTVPAILNRPSVALPVVAGKLRVYANSQPDKDGEPPLFGEYIIPEAPGHYDIFINRAPDRKDWQAAQSLVLPSDHTAFPDGSFRVVNLCGEPLRVMIGTTRFTVAPRRSHALAPDGFNGKLVPLQAFRIDGGRTQWIMRTGMRITADQRANLVFYPGRDPQDPCKATTYYQSDPEPLDTATE